MSIEEILNQHAKDREDSGSDNNLIIFDVARIAIAALSTAALAGNVTCRQGLAKVIVLLKESKK